MTEEIEETEVITLQERLATHLVEGKNTLVECFEDACDKHGDKLCYKWRRVKKEHVEKDVVTNKSLVTKEFGEIETLTYKELKNVVHSISSGLKKLDDNLQPGSRIGIYLDTSKEWFMSLQAILRLNMTVVTVYTSLLFPSLIKCINEAELQYIVCSAANVQRMDENLADKCPTLKNLIVVGNITYQSKKFEMTPLYDILLLGGKNPVEPEDFPVASASDHAVIMYTSGTTGDPKGVMMRHSNLVSMMKGVVDRTGFNENDVHFSYLPFAHIFELIVHNTMICVGAEICFGSPRTMLAKPGGAKYVGDLAYCRPTVFCGVPRVWETIKKAVEAKVRSGGAVKQWLFGWVMGKKLALLKEGKNEPVCLENVVFKKIRGLFGGRLRMGVTGGAPMHADTQSWFAAALGHEFSLIQAWGLTETIGGGAIQERGKFAVNSVGKPLTCTSLKLISVPELSYLVSDKPCPRGEILIKGPVITDGYYKKPELTAEVYEKDGWFHTGDIARLNKDGTVSIIDRRKHLIKMPHGEYVAIEPLEMLYGQSSFVAPNGICVNIDPHKSFVIGIVLPDLMYAREYGKKMKLGANIDDIIMNPQYMKAMKDSFDELWKGEKRQKHEQMSQFVVVNDLWTPDNGCLTAAAKLKRRVIKDRYAVYIKMLFNNVPGLKVMKSVKEGLKKDVDEEDDEIKVEDEVEAEKLPSYFAQLKPTYAAF